MKFANANGFRGADGSSGRNYHPLGLTSEFITLGRRFFSPETQESKAKPTKKRQLAGTSSLMQQIRAKTWTKRSVAYSCIAGRLSQRNRETILIRARYVRNFSMKVVRMFSNAS